MNPYHVEIGFSGPITIITFFKNDLQIGELSLEGDCADAVEMARDIERLLNGKGRKKKGKK